MKRKVYMKNAEENLKVCLVTWYGSNNYGSQYTESSEKIGQKMPFFAETVFDVIHRADGKTHDTVTVKVTKAYLFSIWQ